MASPGESGDSPARLGAAGPVHLRPRRPLHWQLRLFLLRVCEEGAGRAWAPILLFWHGQAWEIKSQRRTLSRSIAKVALGAPMIEAGQRVKSRGYLFFI